MQIQNQNYYKVEDPYAPANESESNLLTRNSPMESRYSFPKNNGNGMFMVTKIQYLGDGHYGSVFKVKDQQNKFFALKLLLGERNEYPRDYSIGRKLHHPNMQKTYYFNQTLINNETWDYILIEYVNGKLLGELLGEKEFILTRQQMYQWISQILSALVYCLNHDIMPGDLQSENIMVTHVGEKIKLIDFGLYNTKQDYMHIEKYGFVHEGGADEVETQSAEAGARFLFKEIKFLILYDLAMKCLHIETGIMRRVINDQRKKAECSIEEQGYSSDTPENLQLFALIKGTIRSLKHSLKESKSIPEVFGSMAKLVIDLDKFFKDLSQNESQIFFVPEHS